MRQADRRGEVQRGHESAARGRRGHVRDAARPALGHGGGGDGAHAAPLAPAALTRPGAGRRRIGRDVETTAKEAKARMDLTRRKNSETGVCDEAKYIIRHVYDAFCELPRVVNVLLKHTIILGQYTVRA